jgi:outer membrane protein OmpA-like peptidoglycan-associated protein
MRSMVSHSPCALAVAGVFALGVAGCATSQPPADQMTVATASVTGANAAAGAQTHPPHELQLANDKLANAQRAMADKEYGVALRSTEQAHADAQLAVVKTQAARARKAADDAQAAARALREERDRNALRTRPGDTDKARAGDYKAARDLLLAQRDTQEKAIELAVAKARAQHDRWRASDLEMNLKDMNAKQTERGDVITLGDVLFDSNRATLRSGGLRDMAKVVEGFTDSLGSESDNLELSRRRASSVRDALIDQSVFADRLTSRGHSPAWR